MTHPLGRTAGRTFEAGAAVFALAAATAVALPSSQAQAAPRAGAGEALRVLVKGAAHGHLAIYAWPTTDRLASARTGEQLAMALLQSGPLGADGRFSVQIDNAKIPVGYETSSGQVDLRVVVTAGQRQSTWDTSVSNSAGNWNTTRARSARMTSVDQVTLDLAGETAELASDPKDKQINRGPTTVGQARLAGQALATSDKNLAVEPAPQTSVSSVGIINAPTETCVTTAGSSYNGLTETFATVYGWSGATGTMDSDTGSNHTLGVGLGSSTGWKQSGTVSIGSGAGATVGGIADAYVVNKVNYRDYYSSCSAFTTRKATGFYALLPSGSFTRATDTNYTTGCSYYYPGGTAWKSNVSNYTYSGGVDIGPLNVSAQSGWNTATKMTYNVTSKSKICGSTSAGWLSSPGASSAPW